MARQYETFRTFNESLRMSIRRCWAGGMRAPRRGEAASSGGLDGTFGELISECLGRGRSFTSGVAPVAISTA